MPKTFYTERDIEDLAKQGVSSLVITEDVVLTDLARDKARRLGIELLRDYDKPPSAPERPYITKIVSPSATTPEQSSSPSTEAPSRSPTTDTEGIHQRVRTAVLARLGDTVDPKLLDAIIRRVLENIKTS
ncbi:MAG: hypothetical protein AB1345_03945 [Chloroflexota bacterium]